MLTVKEFILSGHLLGHNWQIVGIEDGWKPLALRRDPETGEIILPAIVDTDAPMEREVVRFIQEGQDLYAATEGRDAAPLGYVNGLYVFVDLAEEEPDRRISHPAILAEQDRMKREAAESLKRELDSSD